MCRQAIITQSVGVPLTAKRRSAIWRSRSGEVRVSECDAPDCSFSGATTQTSSDRLRAIFSATIRPGEWMPSSLVTRMRMSADLGFAAHIRLKHGRNGDAAIGLLVVFQDGDQGAAHRKARTVQGMHRTL